MIEQALANFFNALASKIDLVIVAVLVAILSHFFAQRQRSSREKYEDKIRRLSKLTEFLTRLSAYVFDTQLIAISAENKNDIVTLDKTSPKYEKNASEFSVAITIAEIFGNKKIVGLTADLNGEVVSSFKNAKINFKKTKQVKVNLDNIYKLQRQIVEEVRKLSELGTLDKRTKNSVK